MSKRSVGGAHLISVSVPSDPNVPSDPIVPSDPNLPSVPNALGYSLTRLRCIIDEMWLGDIETLDEQRQQLCRRAEGAVGGEEGAHEVQVRVHVVCETLHQLEQRRTLGTMVGNLIIIFTFLVYNWEQTGRQFNLCHHQKIDINQVAIQV